ncbi:MAG: SURF1 family protein [Gammaproteobacteria bacterium]
MTTRPTVLLRLVVLVTLFTVACALLATLGLWQLHRAESKRERYDEFSTRLAAPPVDLDNLRDDLAADDYRWRRAEVRGRYRDLHVLLDNRVQHGRAGYEVLTPLATAGGHIVLVDRGWVPLPSSREAVPELTAPQDPYLVRGFLGEPPVTGVALNAAAGDAEWLGPRVLRVQHLDLAALAPLLGFRPFPGVLYLDSDGPGALAVEWSLPGDGSARHVAYAVQWFAMAAVLAGIGAWNWRRARHHHD